MEPSDFDKLIKDKLVQGSDLHEQHSETAKPFVWTAIQANRKSKPILIRWYYAAAAAILFIVMSSVLFLKTEQNYQREFNQLAQQFEQFKNRSQTPDYISVKNEQLDEMCAQIDQLQLAQKNSTVQTVQPVEVIKKEIVYKIDTVYLKQIEYIVQELPISNIEEEPQFIAEKPKSSNTKTSNQVIFLESKNETNSENNSTALRIKLANFSTN